MPVGSNLGECFLHYLFVTVSFADTKNPALDVRGFLFVFLCNRIYLNNRVLLAMANLSVSVAL